MSAKDNPLQLKLRTLPEKPGIYQYFDSEGKILYVGKAKNLKKRVSSYFNKTQENGKTIMLVKRICDIQYMVVDSELDALLLENNLIKKYQPKYNIQLKDDKTYPWICIKNEPFPRVFSTRNVIKDGSKYFGPYPSGKVMHTLLHLIKEIYPLRNCNFDLSQQKIKEKKYKVCLEYHLGNCKAPCVGYQKQEEYDAQIAQIENLVKGNISSVIHYLKTRMNDHAVQQEYELAHDIKVKLQTLENYQAKSTIVSPSIHEVDIITLIDEPDNAFVNYLCIHNGAIIHAYTAEVKKKLNESREDVLGFVLPELRERFSSNSKEVLVDAKLDLKLEGITFTVPQRGDKKQLIELSLRNEKFYKLEKQNKKRSKILNGIPIVF